MTDRAIPSNANFAFILATLPKTPEGWKPPERSIPDITDAVMYLAELAMRFGKIDRTACYHPDRRTKETDATHTVMLGWVGCALAARYFPELNVGLVAQLALVHDAPEVYAGGTQTLRISPEERVAKKAREAAAVERLSIDFGGHLPWFPNTIADYEEQELPEARFIRALDKSLPKIVHLLDGLTGLREFGITHSELSVLLMTQFADVAGYAGKFQQLLDIRQELTDRLLRHERWLPNGSVAPEPEVW